MAKQTKNKKKRVVIAVAAGVFIAAALLAWFNRDALAALLGGGSGDRGEQWAFEAGASQVFAPAGNGLAVASATGLQLLGDDGYTAVREVCALGTPAVSACAQYAAAYDVGGTVLRVAGFDGSVTDMDTENTLISVRVNETGFMAVCTEESGYKGLVTVYDSTLKAIYEWYSGEGYLLSAEVSPDGTALAVLTAAEDGGHVKFFLLTSEEEQGDYTAAGELLLDARWVGDDRVCALSESRAVFLENDGGEAGAFDYGGMYLADCAFGGDFAVLALSKYLSGSVTQLVSLDDGGGTLGQAAPDGELKALSAGSRQVLALCSDGLTLYSRALTAQGSDTEIDGVKTALLRKNGGALLVYTGTAQPKSF